MLEDHPSYKYIGLMKRSVEIVPEITSTNLFPDVALLQFEKEEVDDFVSDLREIYAKLALILFYPYRNKEDLTLNGFFWLRYKEALLNGQI